MKITFLPNLIHRSPLNPTSKIVDATAFNEALYLSTPTFHQEYQKHLGKPLTDTKELKKLNISLYKYQTRASTRCTPFGLFAGLGISEWNTQSHIGLNSNLKISLNRKTRLDMNVLCALAQELAKQDFIKSYLKFYPNTSLYLIGNSYRYVEYYYSNNQRFHKINKVDFTQYLQHILTESKTGLNHHQLIRLLINDDISEEEATFFIDELISSQLLINQLEPTVTGVDYFEVLLSNLKDININHQNEELSQLLNLLNNIDLLIKNIDTAVFNSLEGYKNVHTQLKTILPELSETNLFQTDLFKTSENHSLNINIQNQLQNTIKFLNKISPATPNNRLDEFKKKFTERYEDYEIPLLVALDTETGVGYPAKDTNGINELIEDIYATATVANDSEIKWNLLQSHLLKLITESNKQHEKVIHISETDFKGIDFSDGNLPITFTVMFKVLNATTQKIDMRGIGGSSAINLLGRFAGGNKELNTLVNTISNFEQLKNLDKILAEIVHLPESRVGNILARPNFRTFEIPYLAKASVNDEFQIKMEDLTIKVAGNNLILFDKRLQKEIIPRLSNAHNFSFNSLPVYQFLCDLQTQYFTKPYIGFNWGVLSNQFDFLPRVEYQNTVLSSAKWQLKKIDLEPLQNKKITDEAKHNLFYQLKNKIELPDKFLIADGDNELLIDCNNPIAIDTFIDTVKNRNDITLEEYLFEDEHALIKDSNGNSYTNECIGIILNEDAVKEQSNLIASKINSLPTGSVNISGSATQNQILTASNNLADADGLRTISYQWLSNGSVISNANQSTYTLTQADIGKVISVKASYTDLLGTAESVMSSQTNAVAAKANSLPTGSVNISGTATQNQKLTAK